MPFSITPRAIEQAYETGSPALAVSLAEQFLRSEPHHPPVLLVLGRALTDMARYTEARATYRQYAELVGGESAVLCRELGRLSEAEGDFVTAQHWFDRSIAQAPDDARGYISLGAMFAARGRLSEAYDCHKKGTVCSAGPAEEAWYNLGLVARALGRHRDACECFDRALALDPHYAEARRARADVIQAKSLLDEA